MPTRRGIMATKRPARYAKQLASHWADKGSAVEEYGATVIRLETGQVVVMRSTPGALMIDASVPDEVDLDEFADVVKQHLERFGERDELTVIWDAEPS